MTNSWHLLVCRVQVRWVAVRMQVSVSQHMLQPSNCHGPKDISATSELHCHPSSDFPFPPLSPDNIAAVYIFNLLEGAVIILALIEWFLLQETMEKDL